MTLKERIIELLKTEDGYTDREITDRIFGYGYPQQSINIACRDMDKRGIIRRAERSDGKLGNYLVGSAGQKNDNTNREVKKSTISNINSTFSNSAYEGFSEDQIKQVLNKYMQSKGWSTQVAMGRDHGIDIDAYKEKSRWIIEVKGCGSRDAMRVNYFLAILGETLQRMNDPNAKYSIALPNIKQFRNLWDRLPRLAKDRTGISAIFVDGNDNVEEVL